jgi:hypothetical protein
MVGMRRAWLLATLCLAWACARPSTPEEVVRAYFASLGRDPLRCGSLVTGSFQRSNGFHFAIAATGVDAGQGAASTRAEAEALWLATQTKTGFEARAARLAIAPLAATRSADAATVSVRVDAPGAPSFVQRFDLARGADGRWRIDRIVQEGVEPGNLADAFVAAPSEALRQRLAQSLGVHAD